MIYIYLIGYIGVCLCLYYVSHKSLQSFYLALHRIVSSDHVVKVIISIWYFVGTLVHELSHLIVAIALGQKIHSFTVLPVFEHGGIKLGSVVYYKRDRFRGILVGIAPLFGGTIVAYGLYVIWGYFGMRWWIDISVGYLLFVILTNMFSSPQDLQDVVYLVPLGLCIVLTSYISGFDLYWFAQTDLAQIISVFLIQMIEIGCVSILTHFFVWGLCGWLVRQIKR